MQVFKFGGASVKDAASVKNVFSILKKHVGKKITVVVSAMGKTTNKLEELVRAYFYKDGDVNAVLKELRDFHLSIADTLFSDRKAAVYNEIENVFVELLWALEEEPAFPYNHHYDQMVSQGEILSTLIVSAYMNQEGLPCKWLDARGIIQTDNNYRDAKLDYELTGTLVRKNMVPLFSTYDLVCTQGFIGGTSENFSTTLGREGSDYTAALLAYFTDAESVTIWKDVPGVLNADPRYFKNAEKMDEINYYDAIELTYFGATVIHPKTIKPLQNKNIPLYVRSFLQPEEEGTVIRENDRKNTATNYILKDDQMLLSIMPKDFSFIVEDNLSFIFSLFSRYSVRVNMMQNAALSFSVCIDNDVHKTTPLLNELQKQFKVLYNSGVQLMTIRNYNQDVIARFSEGKIILLEQRSRNTFQMVIKDSNTK